MTKKDYEINEYLDHFPKGISKEIEKYAIEEVFKYSRYIFTHRQGKYQYGYCTYCHNEFETKGLKHNKRSQCPKCNSKCTVKASGFKRSMMFDEAYFVYYEISAKNPDVIVARGIYAVRDYTGDYHEVETKYLERARYVFEMGNSVMLHQYGYYSMAKTMKNWETFNKQKTVFSLYGNYHNNSLNVIKECSHESIRKAVSNTPFRYSTWESYADGDMVKFFDLYSKYPCIEYLTKLGLNNLVMTKLTGGNTYSAINWRATSLLKVLKLSKRELTEIKSSNIGIEPLFLRIFQVSRKDGSNLTLSEISEIRDSFTFKDLQRTLKYATLRQIRNYISRQHTGIEESSNQRCGAWIPLGHSKSQLLSTWNDYIADCITLDMNLADERILFPKNLFKAHQKTTKRIKSEGNELLDKKIRARLLELNYYCFEYQGLMIRPADSTKELIEEGKELVICVGNYQNGYMTKYAAGKTNLLLIRKVSKPDKPFYTMELKNDSIIQVQGQRHCLPTEEVTEFIEAFKTEKIQDKKVKSKVRISA